MLLNRIELQRIADRGGGLVFRHWRRPTVKAGGTLRTRIGLLAVAALDEVSPEQVSETDARAAGFVSRTELLDTLPADDAHRRLYRIALRLEGEDPRVALREQADLDAVTVATLRAKLDRLDQRFPWTRPVLELIALRPGVRAQALAAASGLDKAAFKQNVRKLKDLGLTESLEVGYRLSPRGRALLQRL
ncbi:MAG: hypothetical protein ACFCVH_06495 [Alphaproteobacteria bacterium]